MQGSVISLVQRGVYDNLSHPHLVVILKSDTQALCVPGFTPGKTKHAEAQKAAWGKGLYGPEFEVVVDHRVRLMNTPSWLELHDCSYVVADAVPIAVTVLQREGTKWGDLAPDAVKAVAEGLILNHAKTEERLPREIKLLKKLLSE